MKEKYFVEFQKVIQYHVEADSPEEAEQLAREMDADKDAQILWATNPYEEIIVERD
jgi:hypothetical protein